ncbi:MAG TPA: cytochrome c oxidase subunit 3, partial [Acetobacteraceae bacterium]|nr:cytochrome c oxidase subunit 3 [Acetobacteraceae bacterium]
MSEHAHGTTVIRSSGLKQPYHLVDPSPWPIVGAVSALLIVLGIVFAAHYGTYTFLVLGTLLALTTMFFWWRSVLRESRTPGMHSAVVRLGLRYGMMFFISSEVMFFVAFFWAFFNFALFPEHVAGVAHPIWPPPGIHSIDPLGLPILNTMILLLSGTTVTWAHHSLLHNDRKGLVTGLALTVLLGLAFTCFQAWEFTHAPFHFVG